MHLLGIMFGILGNVTSIMVQLSPVPTFWRMVKTRSTGSFSAQPYVWGLTASLMWSFYAILQRQMPLISINVACIFFQLAYIMIYLHLGTSRQRIRTCCTLLLTIGAVVAVILCTDVIKPLPHSTISKRIHIVGVLCTIAGVLSCAAPLVIMHKVVRTASVEYMPFALSLCMFINSITWLAYALCVKDPFQLIPNAIGAGLATAQLALYTFYKIYGVDASLRSTKITDQTNWSTTKTTAEATCPVTINEVV